MKNINKFFAIFLATASGTLFSQILIPPLQNQNPNSNVQGCINPHYPTIATNLHSNQVLAKRIEVKSNGEIALLESVDIPIEGGSIRANAAIYNQNEGAINAIKDGNIYYLDSYFQFLSGSFNTTSKNFQLTGGKAYLKSRNLLIQYESLKGTLGSNIVFQNAALTSCINTDLGWQILAKTIAIDESSKRGHIKDLKLQIRGKSIATLPYLPFPATTDRLNGFLEPDISFTSDGVDIYLPYFWVLSEKSDITIAPRLLKERGLGLEMNYRYLSNNNSNNYLDLIFFSSDKEFQKQYVSLDSQRWAFKLRDSRKFKKINTLVNWAKSSDSMVLLDLPSNLTNIANQRDHYLPQSIDINVNFGNLAMSLSRQGYQSLNPFIQSGYVKNPELKVNYSVYSPTFSYFTKIQHTDFKADRGLDDNLNKDHLAGTRMVSELGAEANYHFGFLNLELNGSMISKKYHLKHLPQKSTSTHIPSFSLNISSALKRTFFSGTSLIIPKFTYGKTNYKDQSLDPIFDLHVRDGSNINTSNQEVLYGKDRIPDQEYVMGSLRWQAYFKDQKKIVIQISKKNEQEASKVLNQMLDKNISRDNQLGADINLSSLHLNAFVAANYSQKRNELNFGNIGFSIKLPETKISISRNFRRHLPLLGLANELDYSELSINHNLSDGYKLIGGISKDLKSKKNLESYFGVGYENCCVAFKIFASDKRLSKYNLINYMPSFENLLIWENMISIENKSRINFEFELKGFTGSRTQLNKFFSNAFVNF